MSEQTAQEEDDLCRCQQPGWVMVAMHDPAKRRGVWMRATSGTVELCAGREGDDAYVKLQLGDTITRETLKRLTDVQEYGAWMVEEAGMDSRR